jgi:chromosome segregation ATPase
LSSTKRELEDRESQVSSGSMELESVRETLQAVRDELFVSLRSLTDLRDNSDLVIDVLKGELSATKSELHSSHLEILALESRCSQLRDEIDLHLNEISLLQAQAIAAQVENTALHANVDQLKHRLPSTDDSDDHLGFSSLNEDIELEFSQISETPLTTQPPKLEELYLTELNEMKSTLQKTQLEFDKYRSQATEIQSNYQELHRRVKDLTYEKDRSVQELHHSLEENRDLREEIDIIRKKLKESQCQLSDAVMEVKQKMIEVSVLKQQIHSSSSVSASAPSPHLHSTSEYAMTTAEMVNQLSSVLSSDHDSDSIAQVKSSLTHAKRLIHLLMITFSSRISPVRR